MNKSRLPLNALVPVVAGMLLFTACGKKDSGGTTTTNPDAVDKALVGKWEATKFHYTYDNTTVTPPIHEVYDTTYQSGKSNIVEFKADKTYTLTDQSVSPNEVTTGTFLTDKGRVMIKAKDSTNYDTLNYTIVTNTLTVSQTTTGAGETYQFSETFTRK